MDCFLPQKQQQQKKLPLRRPRKVGNGFLVFNLWVSPFRRWLGKKGLQGDIQEVYLKRKNSKELSRK